MLLPSHSDWEIEALSSLIIKVNALRKGRAGALSLKDTCLKFSQAEGNIKVLLVSEKAIKSINADICNLLGPSPSLDLLPHLISTFDVWKFSGY